MLHDKLPALEAKTNSEIVAENLNAMHSARKAFVAAETSEKIRRALRHNIRTSCEVKYFTGDSVFYKRNKCDRWKGPGKVIGQDGQQVLVKHGSVYVRVHPCRLTLEHDQQNHNTSTINTESQDVQSTSISKNVQLFDKTVISSSDESEEETNDITTTESTTDHLTTESTTDHLTTESTTDHLTNESTTGCSSSAVHQISTNSVKSIVTRPKVKQKTKYLPVGKMGSC